LDHGFCFQFHSAFYLFFIWFLERWDGTR
jgi:hypothetical protein